MPNRKRSTSIAGLIIAFALIYAGSASANYQDNGDENGNKPMVVACDMDHGQNRGPNEHGRNRDKCEEDDNVTCPAGTHLVTSQEKSADASNETESDDDGNDMEDDENERENNEMHNMCVPDAPDASSVTPTTSGIQPVPNSTSSVAAVPVKPFVCNDDGFLRVWSLDSKIAKITLRVNGLLLGAVNYANADRKAGAYVHYSLPFGIAAFTSYKLKVMLVLQRGKRRFMPNPKTVKVTRCGTKRPQRITTLGMGHNVLQDV
jgi:hypothetical protein